VHWLTIFLSHKTIAVSQQTKKQVSKMPFIKNKIVVIYNGVKDIDFRERLLAQKEIFPKGIPKDITKETIWIGTISELHKNKGLDYMVSVISKISSSETEKKFIFVIVGEGEERENLEKQIKKEDLENIIFLAGYKKNASSLLKAFDIFTLTSRTEALPYVSLEAGLAELPIIASRVGGIPEVVSDGCGILIEPGNIDKIKQSIIKLLEDNIQHKEYGKKLKEHVTQNLSTEGMVKNTIQYYNELYKK
jgi:glycosyltransferase involved in cell wall biosynthesis